jgi:hypothetical protein
MSARSVALPPAATVVSRILWFAGGVLGLVVATRISFLVAILVLIGASIGWSLGERALLRRRTDERRDAADVGAAQPSQGGPWLGLVSIGLACVSVGLSRSDWRVAIVAGLWFAAAGVDVLRDRSAEADREPRRRPARS